MLEPADRIDANTERESSILEAARASNTDDRSNETPSARLEAGLALGPAEHVSWGVCE